MKLTNSILIWRFSAMSTQGYNKATCRWFVYYLLSSLSVNLKPAFNGFPALLLSTTAETTSCHREGIPVRKVRPTIRNPVTHGNHWQQVAIHCSWLRSPLHQPKKTSFSSGDTSVPSSVLHDFCETCSLAFQLLHTFHVNETGRTATQEWA